MSRVRHAALLADADKWRRRADAFIRPVYILLIGLVLAPNILNKLEQQWPDHTLTRMMAEDALFVSFILISLAVIIVVFRSNVATDRLKDAEREVGALASTSKATKRPSRSKAPSRTHGSRSVKRAAVAFDLLSALVPKRIASEEIGDALEYIHNMSKKGRPSIFIALKVVTTFWWVGAHTGLYFVERVVGTVKSAASIGLGKDESRK